MSPAAGYPQWRVRAELWSLPQPKQVLPADIAGLAHDESSAMVFAGPWLDPIDGVRRRCPVPGKTLRSRQNRI